MTKRLIATLTGIAAIAVLAAGCGSGSDSSSLTKAEFIKSGDAICTKGDKEINDGFQSYAKEHNLAKNEEPSKAQTKELLETVVVPAINTQSEEIRDLGAPSGDEDQVSGILDSLDEGIEEAEEDPEALLKPGSGPFTKANTLAKSYGFKVCGQE